MIEFFDGPTQCFSTTQVLTMTPVEGHRMAVKDSTPNSDFAVTEAGGYCSFCLRKNKPSFQVRSDDKQCVLCDACIDALGTIVYDGYGRIAGDSWVQSAIDGPVASASVEPISAPETVSVPISGIRQNVTKQRDRLGEQQGWVCFYCRMVGDKGHGPDHRFWHVDHLYPVIRGGDAMPDNLVLACATCNLKKKAKLINEFMSGLSVRVARAGILAVVDRILEAGNPS